VQVLRSFAMDRPPGARVTLVVDTPLAVYSGMVPGLVAGRYRAAELEIDAVPLARRAGARVILAAANGIDPVAKRVVLDGRPAIPYDLASIDIGSTVAGLELPGVREHALPTRPIGRFVARVAEVEAAARRGSGAFRVVVAGGGAGGVELAATLRARLLEALRGTGRTLEVSLVHDGPRLLPGYPAGLVRRVERAFERRGIVRHTGRTIVAAEADRVLLDDGASLPCDALLWATGAAGFPLLRDSGLPCDERGFVLTQPTLQVTGHDDLFAAGDCATLALHPRTPKAGVYAVRQGPYLTRNLRAALAGQPLASYRPQRDFLTLLNLGDGSAIGGKWGISFAGRWVMELKDRIDRRFMERFQLLAADGGAGPAQRQMPAMDDAEMVCGGCAAKLGQEALTRSLARLPPPPAAPDVVLGVVEADDVAAFRLPGGDLLVASVDLFRAFTDDPYLVGRAAARNALSDLEAKGVAPRWALALVALPLAEWERQAEEMLFQVLAGARAVFDEAGVHLVGGHTSRAEELQVGFSVQGVAGAEADLLRRHGALEPGQVLVLTRPLGTGVLFHADMAGRARGPWIASAFAALATGNAAAAALARQAGATAATDVTGFGLAGHLAAILEGSGLAARLDLPALPALPGALELLTRGERSTFHDENARLRRALAIPAALRADPRVELLFDPQTAGGLLFAVPEAAAEDVISRLREAGYPKAAAIGVLTERRGDAAVAEVVADLDPAS
jgi:selenide,water dikinase